MATEETKVTRISIEVLDNGYTVETYAYNPYGANKESKTIEPSIEKVLQRVLEAEIRNTRIEFAKKAK